MAIRLEPRDEYMHDPGADATFNESMYFNVYDPTARLGAFFRVGNRPNEGTGEVTVCCYLPDGRVAFMFKRPEVTSNVGFDAGGLRFEVVDPFESLRVAYDGRLLMLDDPLEMADPGRAFTENPAVKASVRLEYTRVSPMFGGENEQGQERPGEEFARGHCEQLVAASGTIEVGEEEYHVTGYGLRDHSWGPRTWQAPWYYRWLTGNAGPDFGFMGSRIARRDGEGTRGGFVFEDGAMYLCDRFEIATTWTSGSVAPYHDGISARISSSYHEREWEVSGRVLRLIPLRNRRQSADGSLMVTRISEGLTEWTVADGRVGYGLSEYLDQIVDGQPVGLAE
ncbi:MAG TPA: hypothetical protein VKA05_02470 [Acidimicrobiales bacterium]|nr:hypothetical protein [Acidimicrobiales bacterium]